MVGVGAFAMAIAIAMGCHPEPAPAPSPRAEPIAASPEEPRDGPITADLPAPVDPASIGSAPLVGIPAGSFVMGHDVGKHVDETPAHRVTISAFQLEATLVTVADFRRFVEATGYRTTAERRGKGKTAFEGMDDWEWEELEGASWRAPWGDEGYQQGDDEPVVMVSWLDAEAYCEHLGRRLPTEAEWEYAMRAGSEGTRYPWGKGPRRDGEAYGLNFWQGQGHRKNERLDGYVYTSPVRAFPPNAWGIYDPVGNVWQWTADWYHRETYERDAAGVTDPRGADDGWARVARGGSWWCSATSCSAYGLFARGKSRPTAVFSNNGFRCAADLPATEGQ